MDRHNEQKENGILPDRWHGRRRVASLRRERSTAKRRIHRFLRHGKQLCRGCLSRSAGQNETALPDCAYEGSCAEDELLGKAFLQFEGSHKGFSVMADKMLGRYEQGDKLKLFARVFESEYKLYGSTLIHEGGSFMPIAVTFTKSADGTYQLEKYEIPKDGSFYASSIREMCTQPVTGEEIAGLADKMLSSESYSSSL